MAGKVSLNGALTASSSSTGGSASVSTGPGGTSASATVGGSKVSVGPGGPSASTTVGGAKVSVGPGGPKASASVGGVNINVSKDGVRVGAGMTPFGAAASVRPAGGSLSVFAGGTVGASLSGSVSGFLGVSVSAGHVPANKNGSRDVSKLKEFKADKASIGKGGKTVAEARAKNGLATFDPGKAAAGKGGVTATESRKANVLAAFSGSASASASAGGSLSAFVAGEATIGKGGVTAKIEGAATVSGAAGVTAKAGAAVAAAAGGAQLNASLKGGRLQVAASIGGKKPGGGGGPLKRTDAAQASLFRIELDGVTEAEFIECSGLKNATDIVEYQEGGENKFTHKFIGQTKFPNIVLKKGVLSSSVGLWDWRNAVINGSPVPKDGSIIMLNDKLEEICRWNFKKAWPCKWDGPDLKAGQSVLAVEALELAHHGFTVVPGDL